MEARQLNLPIASRNLQREALPNVSTSLPGPDRGRGAGGNHDAEVEDGQYSRP
jgi:hypothetical protein